jgi:hypothetical protein
VSNCELVACLRPFTRRRIESLPDAAFGVYGFWYRRLCIYIGSAIDQPLQQRLLQHWMKSHNSELRSYLIAFPEEMQFAVKMMAQKRAKTAERLYIERCAPLTNRNVPRG